MTQSALVQPKRLSFASGTSGRLVDLVQHCTLKVVEGDRTARLCENCTVLEV